MELLKLTPAAAHIIHTDHGIGGRPAFDTANQSITHRTSCDSQAAPQLHYGQSDRS